MDTSVILSGFVFLLLIISNGYVLVEILGKYYFFEDSFKKYGDNAGERFIHYFLAGLTINCIVLSFCLLNDKLLTDLLGMFNQSGNLASMLKISPVINTQVFIFSILYYLVSLIWTLFIGFGVKYVFTSRKRNKIKKKLDRK